MKTKLKGITPMTVQIYRIDLYDDVSFERQKAGLNTYLMAYDSRVIKTAEIVANDTLFVLVYVAADEAH